MDADAGRRPSAPALDRPARAPFGPRIPARQRPQHDPGPPFPDSPSTESSAFSVDAYLRRTSSPPAPAHADVAAQAPSSPPSPRPPSPAPPKSAPSTFVAPPPLTPPPSISFESTPIPWKGLPLEAAQWTFSSDELQEIVSRAIRLSARESFVRLLSLQALEADIPHEDERLDAARAAAQAKWRFEVGRRTMLMQALNAVAASSAPSPDDAPLLGFIGQLASSLAACDALLASILHLADQQSQMAVTQHQHWASALAIALRKLNRAHERQAEELRRVQARVHTLEDELEEAWREAEKMAIQFDDLEHDLTASDEGSSIDAGPVEDPDPTLAMARTRPDDDTGTLGDVTINTDIAVVLGVTATAVASKATLVTSTGSPKTVDKSDSKSVRSLKSTRSRRSVREGPTHVSRIVAARTRSRAASNASLRLPKSLRSPTHASPVDAPPMPSLALPSTEHSFLDMESLTPQDPVPKVLPPKRRPEPTTALPTPPHSAGLPPTRVPSIWLESEDGAKTTRLNGLDRTHSLHIFSSLTALSPRKARRSNLVMSLTGSDRESESGEGRSGLDLGSAAEDEVAMTTTTPHSPTTSNPSPVSLPPLALAHCRGPSLPSSPSDGSAQRPGSAGARLTTTGETRTVAGTPKRSLVSRASSVILRRLSAATVGSRSSGKKGTGSPTSSPSRSREALGRWKGRGSIEEDVQEGEEGGEVMLIGSPRSASVDGL